MITAVIGRRKHRDNRWEFICSIPAMLFITSLLTFMCSDYRPQSFLLEEGINRSFPENDRSISLFVKLKFNVSFVITSWISPEEIWEQTIIIWRFLLPVNLIDCVNRGQFFRDAAMYAEIHSINGSWYWKQIKCFHYFIIEILVIEFYALLSEIELFGDPSALMISPQQIDVIWISLLQSIQKQYYFWAKAASIDVIA